MMDSMVKAGDISSGWAVQTPPAGLLLHVMTNRVLGYGTDCMNTRAVHKQKQHVGSLEVDQISPDAHVSRDFATCTSHHITDE